MKNKVYSLLMAMLSIWAFIPGVQAAKSSKSEVIEIGTGTELSSTLPITTNYGYSATQTLYLQEELNVTGKRITKLAFHYNGYEAWGDNVKIYLKETDETSLSVFDTTGQTLVFDGKFTVVSEDLWYELPLKKAFELSHTKNLKMTIIEGSSGFHAGDSKFYSSATTAAMTIESHRDYPEYSFEGLPALTPTILSQRANIRFYTEENVAGAAFSVIPSQLFYDEIEATTSTTLNATVVNTGDEAVEITGVEIEGDAVFSCAYTGTIQPGEEVSFSVGFNPVEAGVFNATMNFLSNSTISDITLSLKGTAHAFGILKESFEGTTFPPEGWALDATAWKRKNFGGFDGRKLAYRTETASDGYLITPMVTIESDSKISFFAKRFGNENGVLHIAVSDDMENWTEVAQQELTSAYLNYDIDLSAHTGNKYIGFTGIPTLNLDLVRGPVVFTGGNPPAPAIDPQPADLAADQFVNIWLEWTGSLEAQGYKLSLGTDNPPTNILNMEDLGSADQYKAEALAFNTTFYWQVTPYNADGDAVDCPVWSFSTMESTVVNTFPFVEDFEACETDLPEGWINIGSEWSISENGFLGNKAVRSSYLLNDGTAELYSPVFEVGDNMELVFAWQNTLRYRLDDEDTLFIDMAVINGSGWTNLAYLNSDASMLNYELKKFDLSSYAGSQILLRWRHNSTNANSAGFGYMDHVIVREQAVEPIAGMNSSNWDAGVIAKNTWVGSGDTVWLYNIGADGLNVESVNYSGDQFISPLGTDVANLAFGEMHPFEVFFEPDTAGTHSEEMTIGTNGGDVVYHLTGQAMEVPDFTSEGFEEEDFPPLGWMGFDVDQDEIQWLKGFHPTILSHSGMHCALSFSYVEGIGVLTPNDWMIAPRMHLDGEKELSFWMATSKANTPVEHLEVYVSNTRGHLDDFTDKIYETTTKAADTVYRQVILDLRAYADQDIYVAFVHNNSTDNFGLQIDDVTLQDYQANHDPEIVSYPMVSCLNGEYFEDYIDVYDPDEDNTIAFTLEEGPDWLNLSESKSSKRAKLFGIPDQTGVSTIKVNVTDGITTKEKEYKLLVYVENEYVMEGFEDDEWPNNGWKVYDEDGDSYNWFYAINDDHNAGYKSPACAGSESWKFILPMGPKVDGKGALTPDNWMVSPVASVKEGSHLAWWVAPHNANGVAEHYAVYISTTGDTPADFTDIPVLEETLKSPRWIEHLVDLSDYAGQDIWVAFRHYDVTDEYVLKIDNVLLPDFSVRIDEVSGNAQMHIWPNPATEQITIAGNGFEQIAVYNLNGQLMLEQQVTGQSTTINIANLPKGMYMIKGFGLEATTVRKLNVK